MRPNKLFGGVAIFLFGDIMQLKPVQGRYIWCQPKRMEYLQAFLVQPHWEQFSVISLVENHRQEGDVEYANILNRIRVGEHTEEDINILQQRVRPEGHQDMKGSLVIASTHATVNKHNVIGLQQLHTELFILEAINSHSNIPNFKPKINPKKLTVESTAYVQTLKVREGCRVMLIDNIDVQDSLCNGSIGTVRHILKYKNEDVKVILVEFDNINSGRELQRRHPNYAKMFPGCTPILRQAHKYTTSKNSKGAKSNTATVFQFPLILAFSSTTHTIQGLTVYSPRKVSVDLRSVFGPHQAYVMLGRVQGRDDLI